MIFLSTDGKPKPSSLYPACVVTALVALLPATVKAVELEQVAVFEQWPAVSQFITYRNRIWFVNSEPYKDTNVADIYSYSSDDGVVRYERSLFSQDVGDPVIYDGLLYWPYEDPRRSAGTGEYAVTDGTHWQWHAMQSGSVMHVHAMNVCDGDLVATTGSWTGQLHRVVSNESDDATDANSDNKTGDQSSNQTLNQQWELQYDYPAATDSFSRLVSVHQFDDTCIVGASARRKDEAKLFVIDGDERIPIEGWPSSDRVDTLIQHQTNLFAFSDSGNTRELLQYDGSTVHTVTMPPAHRPQALHSDSANLWLATRNRSGTSKIGALWKYDNNGAFELLHEFDQVPDALGSHDGAVVIGTYAPTGGGLWVYDDKTVQPASASDSLKSLQLPKTSVELNAELVTQIHDELLELVSDPKNTADRARGLRRLLGRHPKIKAPEFGAAVTRLLAAPINGEPTTMFTGESIRHEDLIRWYLLTALAINGHGRVDPVFINTSKQIAESRSGKIFDPTIAAIVASGWLQQSDQETLAALMTRLNNKTDPQWVRADVIGALSTITDQRFGYDVAAWNHWWEMR